MPLKVISINFQGRKKTTLDIHFNDYIFPRMGRFLFSKIKKQYPEAINFDLILGDYKAIWIKFKNADAAMDFYKNWKRVLKGE